MTTTTTTIITDAETATAITTISAATDSTSPGETDASMEWQKRGVLFDCPS